MEARANAEADAEAAAVAAAEAEAEVEAAAIAEMQFRRNAEAEAEAEAEARAEAAAAAAAAAAGPSRADSGVGDNQRSSPDSGGAARPLSPRSSLGLRSSFEAGPPPLVITPPLSPRASRVATIQGGVPEAAALLAAPG